MLPWDDDDDDIRFNTRPTRLTRLFMLPWDDDDDDDVRFILDQHA